MTFDLLHDLRDQIENQRAITGYRAKLVLSRVLRSSKSLRELTPPQFLFFELSISLRVFASDQSRLCLKQFRKTFNRSRRVAEQKYGPTNKTVNSLKARYS